MSGEGRIASNDVKIQLMPISVNPNVTAETTFTVGGVEVLKGLIPPDRLPKVSWLYAEAVLHPDSCRARRDLDDQHELGHGR